MVLDIQSKEVIDKISDELKVQPSLQIPRELAKQIQLVYNVNPSRNIQVLEKTTADDAAESMTTTSATKRTFATGVFLSVSKDVLAISINSSITAQIPGGAVNQALIKINYEPTTVGNHTASVMFDPPIELAKSASVTLRNSNATASIDTTGILYFFETDPQ